MIKRKTRIKNPLIFNSFFAAAYRRWNDGVIHMYIQLFILLIRKYLRVHARARSHFNGMSE